MYVVLYLLLKMLIDFKLMQMMHRLLPTNLLRQTLLHFKQMRIVIQICDCQFLTALEAYSDVARYFGAKMDRNVRRIAIYRSEQWKARQARVE